MPEKPAMTGDPFVDAGGLVMETLPQKTVEDKIRYATDVYVDHWKGKLHSIFLHSKITHIRLTNKPELQREGSLDYYLSVLKGNGAISEGYCRICAAQGLLFEGERKNFPLVGSGEFSNFHHFQEPGLLICKDCLIRIFFLPLGVFQSGGNQMLLQFQSPEQKKLWQEDVILENMDKVARGTSEGILKSEFKNPQNALFHFASRLIERFELYEKATQRVRLFFFTNFGSKPDVEIHDLPNPVFSFLRYVLEPDLKQDWMYLVRGNYILSKTKFDFDREAGTWTEKKTGGLLEETEYQGTRPNRIYSSLLSGKSILGNLRNIHRERPFNIHIAIAYLREVRQMQKEQIELIRKLAGKIIELCEKENGNYKRYLQPINAKNAHTLRMAILRMVRRNYESGAEEPFITSEEYIEYLFPDGQRWYEVRDFLLICLYEKLHELRIEPEKVFDENADDDEDVITDTDSF
ncbi:type I-B CRISPR-associated protein Cas8b1/Cst1 [Desulfonema ishimotonii]|uniref:Type I-B CRISPR-associated protein Cas8b1/Cst1 n=2 Tax=Desulfonema ishimotonii TaxID=45657 RepID=A0A401FUM5_9BACT|nr:type I-B CRISPR-associated protein Cas8b1/Cst1 [Desulfonema ishimotonii]